MKCELYSLEFPNGKRYIGISQDAKERFITHMDVARNSGNLPVYCAIRKYGEQNIRLKILVIGNRDYILDLEVKAISIFMTRDHQYGYNISLGGEISPMKDERSCSKMKKSLKKYYEENEVSEKIKEKISISVRKKYEDGEWAKRQKEIRQECWDKKGGHLEESKTAISSGHLELWKNPEFREKRTKEMQEMWDKKGGHSEESKEKMSESQKKRVHTPEEIAKMTASLQGRVFSDEHKEKLKISAIGRILSEETKQKVSESLKEYYKRKKVA